MRRWKVLGPLGQESEEYVDADRVDVRSGALWFYNGVNPQGRIVLIIAREAWSSVEPIREVTP